MKDGVRRGLIQRAPHVYWHMPQGSKYGRKGAPDFTVSVLGLALFIETKGPGDLGALRPEQRNELVAWARTGAVAIAVDDPEAAMWVVDGMLSRAIWGDRQREALCSDFVPLTPPQALRVRRKVRPNGAVFFESREIRPHRSALRDLKEEERSKGGIPDGRGADCKSVA